MLNDLLPLAGLDPMGNGLPEPCHRQREPLVTDHSLDFILGAVHWEGPEPQARTGGDRGAGLGGRTDLYSP